MVITGRCARSNFRTMSQRIATPASQAEMLKDRGNTYFKKERLGAAIEAYTEVGSCIQIDFFESCFITERPLCHRDRMILIQILGTSNVS